jgi:hypothetical protein
VHFCARPKDHRWKCTSRGKWARPKKTFFRVFFFIAEIDLEKNLLDGRKKKVGPLRPQKKKSHTFVHRPSPEMQRIQAISGHLQNTGSNVHFNSCRKGSKSTFTSALVSILIEIDVLTAYGLLRDVCIRKFFSHSHQHTKPPPPHAHFCTPSPAEHPSHII